MTAQTLYDAGMVLTVLLGLALILPTRDTRVAIGRLRYLVGCSGVNGALLVFSERGAGQAVQVALVSLVAVALIETARRFGFRPTEEET